MIFPRLALLVLLAAAPARALVVAAAEGAPAPEAPSAPKPTCPCDDYRFKPLTEKGRAAAEWWDARRRFKISTGVSGVAILFGLAVGHPGSMREASDSYERARSEAWAAKAKAEALGAIRSTGDGPDEALVTLVKGVDYDLSGGASR
jgi:hypothetical protein